MVWLGTFFRDFFPPLERYTPDAISKASGPLILTIPIPDALMAVEIAAFPHLEIAGVHGSFDEAAEVEHIIENAMMSTSGISGILVVSGGQAGVGKAFEKLRLDRRPYVVIYDQTPKNERALKNDHVDFLIDQNGYVQGYEPPRILADILTKGQEPEREYLFTDIKIKTKYNL